MEQCKVCCEDIKEGAKKCIHCDSFQDYRRFLNFSTVVLSLLVALFSVLTVALPVVNDFFEPSDALLNFRIIEERKTGYFLIAASNSGTKEGVIKQVFLKEKHKPKPKTILKLRDTHDNKLIVKPNKSVTFSVYTSIDGQEFFKNIVPTACELLIEYIRFDMKTDTSTLHCKS